MGNLLTILREEGPSTMAGGPPAGARRVAGATKRYARLTDRLLRLSDRNATLLRLASALIAATYLVCVGLVWLRRVDAKETAPLLTFAGLLTWWLVGLWREKASTDLLLAFASEFPEEVMAQVIVISTKAIESNTSIRKQLEQRPGGGSAAESLEPQERR